MESSGSTPIPFKSKKTFTPVSKTKAAGEATLSSKTPENKPPPPIITNRIRNRGVALSVSEVRRKAESLRQSKRDKTSCENKSARKQILSWESPVKKPKGSDNKLPEKYEMLNRFFCNLDDSVKLLRLRASAPTFAVLSKQIECLSDRRFTYRHLSQLKYILPEVIEIKKDLVFDEQTSCMKPDLRITFNAEAVEKDGKSGSETGRVGLRKLFYTRLSDFIKTHPKGEEIPEEPLPPPFNHTDMRNRHSEETPSISSSLPPRIPSEDHSQFQAARASHLVQRHFSRKKTADTSAKASLEESMEKSNSSDARIPIHEKTLSCPTATPIKQASSLKNEDNTPVRTPHVESTPPKLALTPVSIMASTPALNPPPKRSCLSPEDGPTSTPPSKLLRRLPRNRSLKFDSPMKSGRVQEEMSLADDDVTSSDEVLDILSDDLVQSIREKERKALEERDPAISRAKRRREIIASLPKLFNTVLFLFQSSKRCVITREEIIYQIIASRLDMVDRKEVEEELEMLKELAPEWISEKVASSGDMLFRVNKAVSPSTIRAQLMEAK
ncbi:CDT1-like protein a, chloroplastic [Punica granatum]|uniref:CDT1-like protein a, chloroplastic n=1 Tax=Punica granatum TaxID=22663 RepID=A0A6P8ENR4_PUNGR|nr:CDT1-like protein a, chloroplastic [Punica granatum]